MRDYDFPPRQLLTTPLAARYLGLKDAQTLRRWRHKGIGPSYIQYGTIIRYDQGVLDAWLASHVRLPGKPAGSAVDENVISFRENILRAVKRFANQGEAL